MKASLGSRCRNHSRANDDRRKKVALLAFTSQVKDYHTVRELGHLRVQGAILSKEEADSSSKVVKSKARILLQSTRELASRKHEFRVQLLELTSRDSPKESSEADEPRKHS